MGSAPRTKAIERKIASASFTVHWEEAKAFHHELHKMRKHFE